MLFGAVLGYGTYEVAQVLQPLLKAPPAWPDWCRLLLLAFVGHQILLDSVQARLCNTRFPYRKRARYVFDALIAGSFAVAFMAGAATSATVVGSVGGILLLRACWAIFLELETRDECQWAYPRFLVVTYLAGAAAAFAIYWFVFHSRHVHVLRTAHAIWMWVAFFVFEVGLLSARRQYQVPAAEAALLPVGIAEGSVRKTCRLIGWAVAGGWRFLQGLRPEDGSKKGPPSV